MKSSVIQSLWFGNPFSKLERLCAQLFLAHSHEFHLYTYGEIDKNDFSHQFVYKKMSDKHVNASQIHADEIGA